eukprot:CAMPEP_0205920392 /NCGR_PEP_ID=MMETSP1325-20131115/11123_1 /ASSEMBLY_ACC=CAM_ASM_000708 /TAXON_ID=236786 /ORGANISM="Florenciella sp., Strain RCC1007" /LENGTH=33 /DNA_ID= /DNA_START= /DNA_END= /DNA_ORIENTATION=
MHRQLPDEPKRPARGAGRQRRWLFRPTPDKSQG